MTKQTKIYVTLSVLLMTLSITLMAFYNPEKSDEFNETTTENVLVEDEIAYVANSENETVKEINSLNQKIDSIQNSVEIFKEKCVATYYHDMFNGRLTADGSVFSNDELTAAHRTLPFGTMVRVTNHRNNESVIVKITDRGPFTKGKEIDLSKKAFEIIGKKMRGNMYVKIEILPKNYDELEELIILRDELVKKQINENEELLQVVSGILI